MNLITYDWMNEHVNDWMRKEPGEGAYSSPVN